MTLTHPVNLGEGVRIGLSGCNIVVEVNGEEITRCRLSDMVSPPCCLECIEDGRSVQVDGRCPHRKVAYTRMVGLL